MRVPGLFYVNDSLKTLVDDELADSVARSSGSSGGENGDVKPAGGGFLPAVKQVANVAALPGIVGASLAMPDLHSGYGFAIGNVAAFDTADPEAVVSPGGVGFDINCGVRLLRTNLTEAEVSPLREQLAQALFDHIPVGVGSQGIIPTTAADLDGTSFRFFLFFFKFFLFSISQKGEKLSSHFFLLLLLFLFLAFFFSFQKKKKKKLSPKPQAALELGMDWSLREGYAWAEDKEHCEEAGRMLGADPTKVSQRAKRRGLPQLGTLGAGNHYCEVQVVDEVFDAAAARRMGIGRVGQVVVMIHSGSRGLGHQVATDALTAMERAMSRDGIEVNDRQLACARIGSEEGKDYLAAMAAAANFAWVNRSAMTFLARAAFARTFGKPAHELDMHVVYDVSHNIAKFEKHSVEVEADGKEEDAEEVEGQTKEKKKKKKLEQRTLLVHRKGATRAFPPHHPLVPAAYQLIGQPVLIGGTMGTCSYVLTGTQEGMRETFGSTCHGAGRARSRNASRRQLDCGDVLAALKTRGIAIRVASPKLVMEEAPESYKDVSAVVDTCHEAGISRKAVRLRPLCVVKG